MTARVEPAMSSDRCQVLPGQRWPDGSGCPLADPQPVAVGVTELEFAPIGRLLFGAAELGHDGVDVVDEQPDQPVRPCVPSVFGQEQPRPALRTAAPDRTPRQTYFRFAHSGTNVCISPIGPLTCTGTDILRVGGAMAPDVTGGGRFAHSSAPPVQGGQTASITAGSAAATATCAPRHRDAPRTLPGAPRAGAPARAAQRVRPPSGRRRPSRGPRDAGTHPGPPGLGRY